MSEKNIEEISELLKKLVNIQIERLKIEQERLVIDKEHFEMNKRDDEMIQNIVNVDNNPFVEKFLDVVANEVDKMRKAMDEEKNPPPWILNVSPIQPREELKPLNNDKTDDSGK